MKSINLKTLEERLDEALSKETGESLTNWLNQKRNKTMIFEFETETEVDDYTISQYFAAKLSPLRYRYSYELLSGNKSVFEQRVSEIKDRLDRLGVRYIEI